ncbi:MAG: hypothetical protein IPJ40_13330 [Saprospirales bacterium]|nr:hypothetical protein [Saprospirales bacterium]
MARGTYISENLTQSQLDALLLLDEYEIELFSLEDAKALLHNHTEEVNEILENLVHKKVLSRIERGKYCRANFRDEKAIGCFLVPDGAIAYWSALNLHGLTEQFSNTLFIQTEKVKKNKKVFGVSYNFVTIPPLKRDGIIQNGHGSHRFALTDVEKTIVDCFDLPKYSGGYAELIRAFAQADLSSEKMIRYCKAIHNIAATKRMGFLAEFFEKSGMKTFIRFARQQVKESYNPLDPNGPDTGEYSREWRLRLNISGDELRGIVQKTY